MNRRRDSGLWSQVSQDSWTLFVLAAGDCNALLMAGEPPIELAVGRGDSELLLLMLFSRDRARFGGLGGSARNGRRTGTILTKSGSAEQDVSLSGDRPTKVSAAAFPVLPHRMAAYSRATLALASLLPLELLSRSIRGCLSAIGPEPEGPWLRGIFKSTLWCRVSIDASSYPKDQPICPSWKSANVLQF